MSSGHSELLGFFFPKKVAVKIFDLGARPRRAPQELEAGGDARIAPKAVDPDPPAEFFPTIMGHELIEDHLEGLALEGVFFSGGWRIAHDCTVTQVILK